MINLENMATALIYHPDYLKHETGLGHPFIKIPDGKSCFPGESKVVHIQNMRMHPDCHIKQFFEREDLV